MPRFEFDFGTPLATPLRLLGIGPRTAWAYVGQGRLEVRFGPWRVKTPITNVKDVEVTGPYNPLFALGLRVSLSDAGLTFGTNPAGGVCVRFYRRVAVLPVPFLRHPGLTLTVRSPEALRDAVLAEREAMTEREVATVRSAPRKTATASRVATPPRPSAPPQPSTPPEPSRPRKQATARKTATPGKTATPRKTTTKKAASRRAASDAAQSPTTIG